MKKRPAQTCLFLLLGDNARMKHRACHSDPEIMHGEVVFTGTRVPVKSLFDYLEDGYDLDEFLESFPTVRRKQCVTVLEDAKSHAEEAALAHSA